MLDKNKMLYDRINYEEAKKIMELNKNIVILDVRTEEEFYYGHIKGAINIPNEDIGDFEIEELPDKDQIILVYCRSGVRSLQAASKLGVLGYNKIYEFGGIINWPYEIVRESSL